MQNQARQTRDHFAETRRLEQVDDSMMITRNQEKHTREQQSHLDKLKQQKQDYGNYLFKQATYKIETDMEKANSREFILQNSI